MHTMKFNSITKKKEIPPFVTTLDERRGHYAERNEPDMERQLLHDTTYMKYLKWSNSQKQRVEKCLPEADRGKSEVLGKVYKVSVVQDE